MKTNNFTEAINLYYRGEKPQVVRSHHNQQKLEVDVMTLISTFDLINIATSYIKISILLIVIQYIMLPNILLLS